MEAIQYSMYCRLRPLGTLYSSIPRTVERATVETASGGRDASTLAAELLLQFILDATRVEISTRMRDNIAYQLSSAPSEGRPQSFHTWPQSILGRAEDCSVPFTQSVRARGIFAGHASRAKSCRACRGMLSYRETIPGYATSDAEWSSRHEYLESGT